MSTDDAAPAGGEPDADPRISFAWDQLPSGKVQVQALLEGSLIHCDVVRVEDADERKKLARATAVKAFDLVGHRADADALERTLLAIVPERTAGRDAEARRPALEYRVVYDEADPERNGLYAAVAGDEGGSQLTNFIVALDRDVSVVDGGDRRRRFEGRITLLGRDSAFVIAADDYAVPHRFAAAVFGAAGAKARFLARPDAVVRAVSATSAPVQRVVTTAFGYADDGASYLAPSVRVDAAGVHAVADDDPVRVDLGAEQCARHLDLLAPRPGDVDELKRHVVSDLLALHDRRVTSCLLAAAALAVLFRFVRGVNRPALWLVGVTGSGKSFLAKLFMNFFGDFPIEDGSRVGSWSSTANFLQRQGFFFRDALFLVDDYKSEVTHHRETLKLLQNYADGSARGRLNADATTNVSRPIRGTLVATGEVIPENTPSALARTVVVTTPPREKDVERGLRCLAHRERYPALMADFIRHVLRHGRGPRFAARVADLQREYYGPIAGAQNDLRIAANFALLGAAFEQFARYLRSAWPGWEADARRFIEEDLVALRDAMLAAVREQQPSEVFLATLGALIGQGRVQVQGFSPRGLFDVRLDHRPLVGRAVQGDRGDRHFEIFTAAALEAVQESLRRQGMPPLAASPRALLEQLASDGRVLDAEGRPLAQGRRTHNVTLGGRTRKAFRVAASALVDEAAPERRQGGAPPGGGG
jgi:hypothetical protein